MSHQCPGPGCKNDVPDDMLMCRSHWYQVPRNLRDAVWAAWDHGNGSRTWEHRLAVMAAIRSLQDRR